MIILDLWSNTPGKFFCISTKSGSGKWKDFFFAPDEFGKIRAFLQDHADDNIYFCPHGFNRRVRQRAEAVIPNMLWADLDFADPRKMVPKPTIAIESSPGRSVGIWILKGPMTESLNRRLTYKVGADKGGWDLTQALRFPGTRNYKYKSQPRVRVLWDDGPKWSVKGINKLLPPEEETNDGEGIAPSEVFESYQDKMPSWLRRELIAKKITGHVDRSEMLWKIENECLELGMSMDEAFAVIKNSIWNKFAGRRSEDEQLRREIQKVVDHQFKEKPKAGEKLKRGSDEEESRTEKQPLEERFKFTPMKDVVRENMDFVWEPYLARGEVTIMEGDPGLGKSYLAQMVCGAIATGSAIPTHRRGAKVAQGAVVYFDIENSAGSVTQPRLEDNGFKNLSNYFQIDDPFSIDDDEALDIILGKMDLEQDEQGNIACVVFDTLNSYIGKADTHKASESTQAFGIFRRIAKAYNCAVVVLRHLTKGSGAAMYRGQGSVAFSGSARVVISVGVDPNDTETRAMAITKINFAKAPPALTFRIEERPKGKSEFIWGDFVNLTSQEIMDAASEARKEGKVGDGVQDAMEFIEKTITGAAVDCNKLFRMAEKRGIPKKMIDRAAGRMPIEKIKKNKGEEAWIIHPAEPVGDDAKPKKKK